VLSAKVKRAPKSAQIRICERFSRQSGKADRPGRREERPKRQQIAERSRFKYWQLNTKYLYPVCILQPIEYQLSVVLGRGAFDASGGSGRLGYYRLRETPYSRRSAVQTGGASLVRVSRETSRRGLCGHSVARNTSDEYRPHRELRTWQKRRMYATPILSRTSKLVADRGRPTSGYYCSEGDVGGPFYILPFKLLSLTTATQNRRLSSERLSASRIVPFHNGNGHA
jgi:hypothetical protein